MRYRISDNPDERGPPLDQGAFLAIAALSFCIGIGFVIAGMRSKHDWMDLGRGTVPVQCYLYYFRYDNHLKRRP